MAASLRDHSARVPYLQQGYGKISHSGYHSIDCVYQFIKAGLGQDKHPDRVEVVTSFVQPHGFFFQINENDYRSLFGEEAYDNVSEFAVHDLYEKTRNFGETDASIQLTLYKHNEAICLAHLDLQHTGFSRRTWL